jgi:hypothetical protein
MDSIGKPGMGDGGIDVVVPVEVVALEPVLLVVVVVPEIVDVVV